MADRAAKRRPLLSRGRPELGLCLALVDHVTITANLAMRAWIGWLAELGAWLVIEFASGTRVLYRTHPRWCPVAA